MPRNDFVFTDPVAAQQYVQMAQIAAAEEDAKNRAMLGTLQAMTQQNVARENAASERSRYAQQLGLQQQQLAQSAQEAQANRLARSSELDRTLDANKEIAKSRTQSEFDAYNRNVDTARKNEKYNNLLAIVQSDDPPTDSEFEIATAGLDPERKSFLDQFRKLRITKMNHDLTEAGKKAAFWNDRLKKTLGPKAIPGQTVETITDALAKSKDANYIQFNPQTQQFDVMLPVPRIDKQLRAPSIDELRKRTGIDFPKTPPPQAANPVVPGNINPNGIGTIVVPPQAPAPPPGLMVPRGAGFFGE